MGNDRRRRLLVAARTLFARYGIRATGIDAILEAAEVARMTLYHHFGSKETLLLEAVRLHSEETCAGYQRAMNDAGDDPLARVNAAFEHLGTELAANGPTTDLFLRLAAEIDATQGELQEELRAHRQRLLATFDAALEACGVADARPRAEILVLLLDGARTSAFATGSTRAVDLARHLAVVTLDAIR